MFLNYIKAFSVKRILNNSLQNDRRNPDSGTIRTVGIVADENNLSAINDVIKCLTKVGIESQNISVIVFADKVKQHIVQTYPMFSTKDLNWNATFSSTAVNNFIGAEFDLLINYYDVEKLSLLRISQQSCAKFKVGFASIDKRLNDLIIKSTVENSTVFTQEVIKYLKILNKI
jgi:hypothetical protein